MEENVKTQMSPVGFIIAFILFGYYAPDSIFCVSMSTEDQRKTASGDISNTQWGVTPVAACHLPRGYFYLLIASHFGTPPPSTGTQPRRIFDHCVPEGKKSS